MDALETKLRTLSHLVRQSALDRLAISMTRWRNQDAVAIVRVDAIGDFVIWLGAARRLCARYRPRRIVLVANRIVADLARSTGMFDEVVAVDTDAFAQDKAYRFDTLSRMRGLGAAIAVQPTYSRSYWIGDALVRATGAPERIGHDGDFNNIRPWQKHVSDRWYTRLVSSGPQPMHELERNAAFLRGLGDHNAEGRLAPLGPVVELPAALQLSERYFIAVPGAGSARRMWPIARFAAVARAVSRANHLRLVICGSPGETALATELAQRSGLEDALVLAGRTSLPELVEMIRRSALVLANESSAVHIAAAVGTPSVCLLGGGHFGRFMPYPPGCAEHAPIPIFVRMECFGCHWQCRLPHAPDGPFPCIEGIEERAVLEAVGRCLASKRVTRCIT